MNEVVEFINRRWEKDSRWLDGNCYWFAHILTSRFPYLEIYYLPVEGHFIAGDGNSFYDWSGLIKLRERPSLLSYLQQEDPSWYARIVRDCIN